MIRKVSASLLILLAMMLGHPARAAGPTQPTVLWDSVGTLLSGIACNASAGSRTFTIGPSIGNGRKLLDYNYAVFYSNHGAHGDASVFTLTCTDSPDESAEYTLQECTTANGSCTSDDVTLNKAVTGTKKWRWRIGLPNVNRLTCVMTCTESVAGTDTLSVIGMIGVTP